MTNDEIQSLKLNTSGTTFSPRAIKHVIQKALLQNNNRDRSNGSQNQEPEIIFQSNDETRPKHRLQQQSQKINYAEPSSETYQDTQRMQSNFPLQKNLRHEDPKK